MVEPNFESRIILPGFWERFELLDPEDPDSCWIWPGPYSMAGYGTRNINTHRFAYLLRHGEIPEGLAIDHVCGMKPCGNPDHLEAVTTQENLRRKYGATDTHFGCGHPREHNTNGLGTKRAKYAGCCAYCVHVRSAARWSGTPKAFDQYIGERITKGY